MTTGLISAYRATQDDEFLKLAENNMAFLNEKMMMEAKGACTGNRKIIVAKANKNCPIGKMKSNQSP